MKKIITTLLAVIILALVALVIFVYSGTYNIAASEPHSNIEEWLLETMMENSIESRAGSLTAPDLSGDDMIASGFSHFDAMCTECHGAPGVNPDEFAVGLNPKAPELSHEAEEWSAEELFWITKHGIKFTGMPAFGETHSDDDIWAIVAFMKKLPELGYSGYDRMRAETAQSNSDSDSHEDHDH